MAFFIDFAEEQHVAREHHLQKEFPHEGKAGHVILCCAGVKPWSTVEEGADAILNLATSPALGGKSGLYFNGLNEARANAQAYGAEARRRLLEISRELTGLS